MTTSRRRKPIGLLADAFEQAGVVEALQLDRWACPFRASGQFHLRGVGNQRAHDHAGAVAERMHAQKLCVATDA